MAPDLNSVPPSPLALASSPQAQQTAPRLRSRTTSRRTSQQLMAPPALPPSSPTNLNILPSNQNAVNQSIAPLGSPSMPTTTGITAGGPSQGGDNTGVGGGPGPLRHPRPLTAADLHLQLEKEQEAVVNRLTRELSLLRAAQNASVVSNTSSTSASGHPDSADTNANHLLSGPSHPIPSQRRHHRSSSSTSTRSNTAGSLSTVGGVAGSVSSGFGNVNSTTADRTRGSMHRHDSGTSQSAASQSLSLSRQNSISGSRASGASSPALMAGTLGMVEGFPSFYQHQQRPSFTQHREPSSGSLAGHYEGGRNETVVTSVQTTGRYEEVAFHRHELEAVKNENEALKRRIRELERALRERRQSDASEIRGVRSESVSTTASVREGLGGVGAGGSGNLGGAGRGREKEAESEGDGGVRVGESARGVGR